MNKNNESSLPIWNNVTSIFSSKDIIESEDIEAGDYTSLIKTSITRNITQSVEVQTSYKSFFIVMAIGLGFILLSLFFLPMIAFYPHKFLYLFSLGSVIIISSFIFVYGTAEYFSMLFSRERFLFTFIYISSVFLSIYSGFIQGYYFLSLISVILQVVTLIIFCLSFVPGGKSGINFLLSLSWSPVQGIWNKFTGK